MDGALFSSAFLLLLVLDPLGNIPFVLSLLRKRGAKSEDKQGEPTEGEPA